MPHQTKYIQYKFGALNNITLKNQYASNVWNEETLSCQSETILYCEPGLNINWHRHWARERITLPGFKIQIKGNYTDQNVNKLN